MSVVSLNRQYQLAHEINIAVAGDHTRTIQIATPTVGGLMKFAVKTVTCLGCRTVLRTNKGTQARCSHIVRGSSSDVPQMELFAPTADLDWASCIRSRCVPQAGRSKQSLTGSCVLRLHSRQRSRSISHGYGRNVRGVRALYTR